MPCMSRYSSRHEICSTSDFIRSTESDLAFLGEPWAVGAGPEDCPGLYSFVLNPNLASSYYQEDVSDSDF
jgi:hypothetical protein